MFDRERDIFHQTAFSIQNEASKLKTSRLVKTEIGFEEYLTVIKNVSDRVAMSKFRLSNHDLMIEKGRHQNPKIDVERRTCPFCPTQVEDEYHFLLMCPTYVPLRTSLFNKISSIMPDFFHPPDKTFLLWFLLKCSGILHCTAHFISQADNLRTFLLANHKNRW